MKKIFTLLFLLSSFISFSQSTTVVISQVYGAGGNTGAVYNADFVELHNVSGSAYDLTGHSLQYASATSTAAWSGKFDLPAVSIPAGGYYLVQMSTIGANGAALPTVDATATPSIAMASASGKVALVT
ncbi:MAG: lamin tail domain-containing protein, partial [Sphingobacteriales bacterium]